MSRLVLIQCPRCRRVWRIRDTSGGITCDCHLYCVDGDRPIDCSVASVNWNAQFGWPAGAHQDADDEGDDVRHRVRYCSTHNKYIYKVPVFLEFDRPSYYGQRLPKRYTVFPRRS